MPKKIKIKRMAPEASKISASKVDHHIPPPSTSRSLPDAFRPEIISNILDNIRALGLSLGDCARRLRLKPSSLQSWYNNNVGDFQTMVDEARTLHKEFLLQRVVNADDMKKIVASQWLLERKYRQEFAKPTAQAMTVNVQELSALTSQLLDIIARHLAHVDPDIVRNIAEDISRLTSSPSPDSPDSDSSPDSKPLDDDYPIYDATNPPSSPSADPSS